jgi:hypothetical protein
MRLFLIIKKLFSNFDADSGVMDFTSNVYRTVSKTCIQSGNVAHPGSSETTLSRKLAVNKAVMYAGLTV